MVRVVNWQYKGDTKSLPNCILNYCWHTRSALAPLPPSHAITPATANTFLLQPHYSHTQRRWC
jgi:hypothetical protein